MGLLSSIFAPGAQRKSDQLDAELAELNRQRLLSGAYTPEQFETVEAQRRSGAVDVDAEISASLKEGALEGVSNVRNTIGSTINSVVSTAAKLLPWQVWLILAAVGLFYAWPFIAPQLAAYRARR